MTLGQQTARCWAEVDLDRIRHNFRTAREQCPGVTVIPVIKADAYGLGAARVAPALWQAGADTLAVAEYSEALEVQSVCPAQVLVMGYTHPAFYADAVERGILLTVIDEETARQISQAACAAGKTAGVHVKIDTGLHRLGLSPQEAPEVVERISRLPGLKIVGLFTHLALRSRESDDGQMHAFLAVAQALREKRVDFGMLHALDSIGMLLYPEYRLDAVRAGAWIYGSANRHFPDPEKCPLAVRVRAKIAQLRWVKAGQCLGYDDEHPLMRDSLIATVTCGYYDGMPRSCARGYAVVRGVRAPVAGLVMMDQMTLDVTDVPGVAKGDAVTFLGDGISLLEASGWYGWNRNELIARMSRRVPRVYSDSGKDRIRE